MITCAVCNEEGHYARDCIKERKKPGRACKNCGEEGHIAKECDKPRSAENVECKNCGESMLPQLPSSWLLADSISFSGTFFERLLIKSS